MKKKNTKKYKLLSSLPLAGVGKTYTKNEWKRIYGYEIGFVAGANFFEVK